MTDDNPKTGIDLDLDALAPKQVQINYQGRTITVEPLDMVMFTKFYNLSFEMGKIKDATAEQSIEIYQKVEELIKEAIPELKDDKLNNMQILALFNLLSELATPQDKALAELKKRGISLKKGVKKTPKTSASSEQ